MPRAHHIARGSYTAATGMALLCRAECIGQLRRAGPVDKCDYEALARCKFMRRYEDGIEPHPGPGPQGAGKQRPTVRIKDVIHKVGCTFSHHSCKTVPVQGGGGKRRAYICGTCRMKFVQNDPAEEICVR